MTGVFSEVFGAVDHESLAPEEVNAEGNALCVDVILGTLFEVLSLLEAVRIFHTLLEHLSRLHT